MRRSIDIDKMEDEGAIANIEYNSFAGGQKNLSVGPALRYVGELSSEFSVQKGDQLYILKTTAGIGYITMSTATPVTVGVAPAADTFPVFGEQFTLYSAADYNYIKGSAGMHLYILKDSSKARNNP